MRRSFCRTQQILTLPLDPRVVFLTRDQLTEEIMAYGAGGVIYFPTVRL